MKLTTTSLAFLIAMLLALSCALKATSLANTEPYPIKKAIAGEIVTKPKWEIEWDKDSLDVKKEGKLVIYSTAPGVIRGAVRPAFKNISSSMMKSFN